MISRTLRLLSALLCYPEQDLLNALPDIARPEAGLPPDVQRFIAELVAMDLLDAQERYVALFDRNRSLSLHLYEHVHGESRDRGQAMVRLASLYQLHGLEVAANELPDYLPMYLEFLSVVPEKTARTMLAEAVHVVAAVAEKLEARDSPYAAILRAVETLAARPAQPWAVQEVLGHLDPEADAPAALDRDWEDEAIRFTAPQDPAGARP